MAYGAILPPPLLAPLPTLSFPLTNGSSLITYPVTGSAAPSHLIEYLYNIFSEELAGGRSYPQEGPISLEAYISYFFSSTTIIGIVHDGSNQDIPTSLEAAIDGRELTNCVGGCYYIKPNYPGRSSHNAGFIVPPSQRGRKMGLALGKSYLEYAPRLGYRGSVFNLVYKNNLASLRIWDQLGFQRVGLIPNAGRLKTGPNGSEEYVDAVVIFKSFV